MRGSVYLPQIFVTHLEHFHIIVLKDQLTSASEKLRVVVMEHMEPGEHVLNLVEGEPKQERMLVDKPKPKTVIPKCVVQHRIVVLPVETVITQRLVGVAQGRPVVLQFH